MTAPPALPSHVALRFRVHTLGGDGGVVVKPGDALGRLAHSALLRSVDTGLAYRRVAEAFDAAWLAHQAGEAIESVVVRRDDAELVAQLVERAGDPSLYAHAPQACVQGFDCVLLAASLDDLRRPLPAAPPVVPACPPFGGDR